jgi:hypothetical protein
MPLPPRWNPIGCGRLCSKKRTTPGFGLPSAERAVKWSPMPLEIGAGKTCQRLWEAIADSYRAGHCYTDFWAAYQAVIPKEQHTAVGKETGETAHVERWKNTALAASGSFCAHDVVVFQVGGHATSACLLLFLHRYNRERAILLT